jgi:hypothetical protein
MIATTASSVRALYFGLFNVISDNDNDNDRAEGAFQYVRSVIHRCENASELLTLRAPPKKRTCILSAFCSGA